MNKIRTGRKTTTTTTEVVTEALSSNSIDRRKVGIMVINNNSHNFFRKKVLNTSAKCEWKSIKWDSILQQIYVPYFVKSFKYIKSYDLRSSVKFKRSILQLTKGDCKIISFVEIRTDCHKLCPTFPGTNNYFHCLILYRNCGNGRLNTGKWFEICIGMGFIRLSNY